MLKLIIATANGNDHAIGRNNKLLAHIPADLKYFQTQTTNQVVLMGNTTFKSLQALGMVYYHVHLKRLLSSKKGKLLT